MAARSRSRTALTPEPGVAGVAAMVRDPTRARLHCRVDRIACRAVLRLAVPTVAFTLALAGTAAAAGDPILPLDQVHAGMACTALSVVKGTTVARFGATVEDIVRPEPPATTARILVRTSGTAVDGTGVGQGFSGSPIECRGADGVERIIGAISEGVGQYGGDLVLATPIEAILGQPVDPPPAARSAPRLLRSARALRSPLSLGGLSAGVAAAVARRAQRAGRLVLAAPSAPQVPFAPPPIVPGASIAVGLAGGDVTAGAIGTVSFVDGDRVWAFGHPLDAATPADTPPTLSGERSARAARRSLGALRAAGGGSTGWPRIASIGVARTRSPPYWPTPSEMAPMLSLIHI